MRLILAMIASYSASLLEARKSKRIACSIIYPIKALSCSLRPALVCCEAPSTFIVHQSELFGSNSYWGIFAKKSASTYPFNAKRGLY